MGLADGLWRLGVSRRAIFGVLSQNNLRTKPIHSSLLQTSQVSVTWMTTVNAMNLTSWVRIPNSWPLASDMYLNKVCAPMWKCHYSATYATCTQSHIPAMSHCRHKKTKLASSPAIRSYSYISHFNGIKPVVVLSERKCKPISRRLSSQADDSETKDPEFKAMLKENQDFASNQQSNADTSDSSTSSSESSDSESNSRTGSTVMSHTSTSLPDDVILTSLTDVNLDGTVPEEEDEDEYEDFYLDYEDVEEDIEELNLPISTQRGEKGVYDVQELVTLLEAENARDTIVIAVPRDYKYVDHLVIVTGRSTRHIIAMSEQIKWIYKRKRGPHDPKTVKIEGQQTKDWMALDLGNIAVHLFLSAARETYDLETLWAVGAEWDPQVSEQIDPFTLYVNWGNQSVDTEPVSAIDHQAESPAGSMESTSAWHGAQGKS